MPSSDILLITADPGIERSVCEAACKTGHTLAVARTSHEAVKQLLYGFENFNLILMDLDSDVHGVTLFNALENCPIRPPVVALTGYEEFYMKPVVMKRGAANCLGKPVTASRFVQLFEELSASESKEYRS